MVNSKSITITHLYRREMNIYGDIGNVIALKWRLEQRGYKVIVKTAGIGQPLDNDTDIIFSGGGQDSGQFKVADDLKNKQKQLRSMHKDGVVFLTICGMFQLLGHSFKAVSGEIAGIGLFDMETVAGTTRLIGNTVIESKWGLLVGFENHSGKTFLSDVDTSLGLVKKGAGNNDEDYTEGCIALNAFGTYMHGPALPKNPVFADELIKRALSRKYGKDVQLGQIDDSYAVMAANVALKLPR